MALAVPMQPTNRPVRSQNRRRDRDPVSILSLFPLMGAIVHRFLSSSRFYRHSCAPRPTLRIIVVLPYSGLRHGPSSLFRVQILHGEQSSSQQYGTPLFPCQNGKIRITCNKTCRQAAVSTDFERYPLSFCCCACPFQAPGSADSCSGRQASCTPAPWQKFMRQRRLCEKRLLLPASTRIVPKIVNHLRRL